MVRIKTIAHLQDDFKKRDFKKREKIYRIVKEPESERKIKGFSSSTTFYFVGSIKFI